MKKFYFEDMDTNTDLPFYIGPPAYLNMDFPIHAHDFAELVIITEGQGMHQIEGDSYAVKAGDVYVIKGDTPHGFNDVEQLKLYNIMYLPDDIFLQFDELKKMPGFQALFILEPFYRHDHEFQSKLVLNKGELNYVKNILSTIIPEYEEKKPGFKSLLKAYLTILLVYLSRKYKVKDSRLSREIMKIAESIIYIENNYTQELRIDGIAAKANLSRRHFTRIFKQNYFLSPYEYIINLRLRHACGLLKNSTMTITNIAEASGFSDPNYFSRHFKNKKGLTPSEFRRKYQ